MRFGLLQEGHLVDGVDTARRYHEMVDEVVLAEQVGFDFYCLPEQHFLRDVATVSAPEVLFAYMAARTETIRLRFTSQVLLSFNHPVRIAERVAALDIMSNGRVELGTARSNNLNTLEAFGVDPKTTRDQWGESLEVLQNALSTGHIGHAGSIWNIPDRPLVPLPIQRPHPPIYVSATSLETHRRAGQLGLGVMNGNNILGWEYLEACLAQYEEGLREAAQSGVSPIHASRGVSILTAHCADDPEQARREAADAAFSFIDICVQMYSRLSETSPDYEYLGQIKGIAEHSRDLDYLIGLAPYISIGTPEFLIERFRHLKSLGADEILMRIDGMGHDVNLRAIDTIGRRVIAALNADDTTQGEVRVAAP